MVEAYVQGNTPMTWPAIDSLPHFEWLEKGVKPSTSTIVATQRTVAAGATPASRPLCKYPQYPKYVSGDPNAAASFVCTTP